MASLGRGGGTAREGATSLGIFANVQGQTALRASSYQALAEGRPAQGLRTIVCYTVCPRAGVLGGPRNGVEVGAELGQLVDGCREPLCWKPTQRPAPGPSTATRCPRWVTQSRVHHHTILSGVGRGWVSQDCRTVVMRYTPKKKAMMKPEAGASLPVESPAHACATWLLCSEQL
jgi:hypothetical protein